MGKKRYTPNDNQNVIRMLSYRYVGSARGTNRILILTVVLAIVTLTMVFGITRGKIRAEELGKIRTEGTVASGVVEKEMHLNMPCFSQRIISNRRADV